MNQALISNIQRYSTKDGPGLRTTVFFMGCNLRCKWCANPENLEYKERIFYYKERCKHCGLCVKEAHHHSISFQETGCKIDRNQCDNIFEMVDLCPYDAYEKIGKRYDVETLVHILARDKEFYETGNGGVTFSGGEATLQADFIIEVIKELHKQGIHTCLDTAGLLEKDQIKKIAEYVDMILFDIKAMDEQMHIDCTGVSNTQILENLKYLANRSIPIRVRLVIVPQYNDDLEDMKQRIDFIASLGKAIEQVDILKYHRYGIGKYEKLDEVYPIDRQLELDEQKISILEAYAKEKGLHVTIGG